MPQGSTPSPVPTIGRIVHYRPSEDERKVRGPNVVPAMIAAVWSARLVNLQVNWANSPVECVTAVELEQENDLGKAGRWFWPPRAGF